MEKEELNSYKKAGEITLEAQELAKKTLKEGANLFDFAEKIEEAIKKKGGFPAFPINLSVNEVAAHYTPSFESKDELPDGAVIKVDIGVHVDGFICDSARTIDFSGKYKTMVSASEEALEEAVKLAKEGMVLGKIGSKIESTIKGKGFKVIENLSGHGVKQNDAHTYPTIPNISNNDSKKLEDGMVIAIEPFATNGAGFVREGNQAEIFQLIEKKGVRTKEARQIMDFVDKNYKTLPFAERWIQRELKMPEFARKVGLRELMQKKCITAFPLLHEKEGSIVTQAETTLVLHDGKVTRLI
ncbi:MAG TPA: type II methionyl aminopeptidase [archaeon]|nr:type II methionyl aminopeptidase [archaeon]